MKMQKLVGSFAALPAAIALCLNPATAHGVQVAVPATSDIWLAGMPAGSTAAGGDVAPDQSPVEVTGLDLGSGGALAFTNATGGAQNTPGCPLNCDPIDGAGFISHSGGEENGIAGARIPINALLGVFLDDVQPSLSPSPASLDFLVIGLDFLALSPLLKQVFFIGDGLTSGNVVQAFNIPDGATRLFLGTMDGFGWFNNSGTITVDVAPVPDQPIPEPATAALLGLGLAGMGWLRQRAAHPTRPARRTKLRAGVPISVFDGRPEAAPNAT